jgi:hypothetical protein
LNGLQTLETLRQLGAGLRIDDGGQLIVTAPRGVIGADLAADIRANKPALLAMLADPVAEVAMVFDAWLADPTNTSYAAKYAAVAIRAGLPFYSTGRGVIVTEGDGQTIVKPADVPYPDGIRDLGAWGWDCFAIQAASEVRQ